MMLINGSHVMLLEVKYKAHPDQVEELAKGKTKFFRKQYTDYQNHALHFGIAFNDSPKGPDYGIPKGGSLPYYPGG